MLYLFAVVLAIVLSLKALLHIYNLKKLNKKYSSRMASKMKSFVQRLTEKQDVYFKYVMLWKMSCHVVIQ